MKQVMKQKSAKIRARKDLIAYEYPHFSAECGYANLELNGRHPSIGYIINKNSDEAFLVYQGSGEIYMDGVITNFEAGDIVAIQRGTKFYCTGNAKFFHTSTPPWYIENEIMLSWFSMSDFVIDWHVTYGCVNACTYCYAADKVKHMSKADEDIIINKIVDSGCKTVCLSGGEPLLNIDRITSIIDRLYDKGIAVHISTTGINFLENKDKLEDKITKLSLSLDGYDKDSNQAHGRRADEFERVIKILEHYKANNSNFAIKIGTTLTSQNLNADTIKKMYELLKDYPIDFWELYEFIPKSRGAENYNELSFRTSQFKKLKKLCLQDFGKTNFPISFANRKKRSNAYFIIRPDGTLVIPIDKSKRRAEDLLIGDLVKQSINDMFIKWSKLANRKHAQLIWASRKVTKQ